uniref:Peptidase_M14 domain-containing protein n=1 Tax=Heterorhabditis bacteriophora TaxID=37862 RepID=A0A1I7WNE4_HETBA
MKFETRFKQALKSGSSFEPCSNIYHGEHVFSEPEAVAVRDFLDSEDMKGKVDAFITLHSYAQLWIYPYSHAEMSYPDDINELRRTARRAINRLHRMYGTEYRMGTGADTLAPASGGSDDWAKSVMGIKYVYLVELRPEMELSNGFILHKKELIPTAVETFEGVKEVIDSVLEHNNIHMDPISKISPLLRKKQLLFDFTTLDRMRLLGLTSSINHEPKANLSEITDISEKVPELPTKEETIVLPSISMESVTQTSSELTIIPTSTTTTSIHNLKNSFSYTVYYIFGDNSIYTSPYFANITLEVLHSPKLTVRRAHWPAHSVHVTVLQPSPGTSTGVDCLIILLENEANACTVGNTGLDDVLRHPGNQRCSSSSRQTPSRPVLLR